METSVRSAIESVIDPDIGRSFGELGAVESVKIDGNSVEIYLELVPPLHYVGLANDEASRDVVRSIMGDSVKTTVFVRPKAIPRIAQADVLPDVQTIIAVASGKGGVGKSTVAANIAAALAQKGASVGLLDADIYGPSAPMMFDLANETMRAEKLPDGSVIGYPNERYGVKIASIGFVMQRDQAAILRGPMLAGYFTTLVGQMQWGALDFLIFDLPPGTGDIQLTLTQRIPLTGAAIVTTPQEIAVSDVRRSVAMFRRVNVDVLGVIENMSWFSPPDMPEKKYPIFGEGGGRAVAAESGAPLLGEIPITLATREGGDEGLPVVLNPDEFRQAEIIRNITANLVRESRRAHAKRLGGQTVSITL